MVIAVVRAYGAFAARPTRLLQRRSGSSPSSLLLLHRRAFASTSPPLQTPEEGDASAAAATERRLVYEGPMARAVRLMKGVSVTSCALTTVGMPVLCFLNEQSASVVGKWAMCGTIMLFGLGTTSLYHVLFQPYVLRMWVDAAPDAPLALRDDTVVTAETLTLLAQRGTQQFALGDVSRPDSSSMHPMRSFCAQGKSYFIHPEELQDDTLMKKLMGDDFQVVKKDPAATKEQDEEDYY